MKRAPATRTRQAADDLYDRDFFARTKRTARRLRTGKADAGDIGLVATEIEDMGKRDARELDSRLQVLVSHLLKWELQPGARSRSWPRTAGMQRLKIQDLLESSPSFRSRLTSKLGRNYDRAIKRAVIDTGLAHDVFPRRCPYSIDQILDEGFLPD